VRLADEIERGTGVTRGSGWAASRLDVGLDGRVVFSKKAEGRLLPAGEIVGRREAKA